MLDARQVEVKRPVTSCRAPGIFHLADPQSSQIPLELQADTIGLPVHGDLQHVRSVGLDRANAMPNVCVYRETRNYPRPRAESGADVCGGGARAKLSAPTGCQLPTDWHRGLVPWADDPEFFHPELQR